MNPDYAERVSGAAEWLTGEDSPGMHSVWFYQTQAWFHTRRLFVDLIILQCLKP